MADIQEIAWCPLCENWRNPPSPAPVGDGLVTRLTSCPAAGYVEDLMKEAAATITRLEQRERELVGKIIISEEQLAQAYNTSSSSRLVVATMCDEIIDRSGALLGRVRSIARALLKDKP